MIAGDGYTSGGAFRGVAPYADIMALRVLDTTGQGVVFLIEQWARDQGLQLSGATYIVQGFGNVGSWAAKLWAERGGKVNAVMDHIEALERSLVERAIARWSRHPGIEILGNLADKSLLHRVAGGRLALYVAIADFARQQGSDRRDAARKEPETLFSKLPPRRYDRNGHARRILLRVACQGEGHGEYRGDSDANK